VSDQTFTPSASQPTSDLQRFREYFTAAIAMVIVLGFIIIVVVTIGVAINGTEDAFGRAKDLLLFVNPIVGIVIGYYFNKVTSDARAEKAESNVQAAAENAQTAVKDREAAKQEAESAKTEIKDMRGALEEVWGAASEMLKDAPVGSGTSATRGGLEPLSAGGPGSSAPGENKTQWKLQEALKRAEKWK